MNKVIISQEELNAYLLGLTSAADTERFDELSITSDEFVEALDAAEIDLADSYVNGDLSTLDRERFENQLLNTGSGRSKVHFSRAFQEFGIRNALNRPASEISNGRQTKAVALFEFGGRYLRWSLAAAAIVLLVVGGWLFFKRSEAGDELALGSATPAANQNSIDISPGHTNDGPSNLNFPPANSAATGNAVNNAKTPERLRHEASRVFAFSLLPQMRSSSQMPGLSIPPNIERISAKLELEPNDFKGFRVTLFDAANREIWNVGPVRRSGSSARWTLVVNPPARLLRAGAFRFTVFGLGDTAEPENLGDYPFRVVQ